MLEYAYNWTGILIVVCFVTLMIFHFVIIIFLHYRYQSKIESFQKKAINADQELQTSRKKYNQAWVIIHLWCVVWTDTINEIRWWWTCATWVSTLPFWWVKLKHTFTHTLTGIHIANWADFSVWTNITWCCHWADLIFIY